MSVKTQVLVQVQVQVRELGEPVVAPVDILVREAKNVTNVERLDTLHVTAMKLVELADMAVAVEDTRVEAGMAEATEVGLVPARLATLVAGTVTCPAIAPRDRSVTIVGLVS